MKLLVSAFALLLSIAQLPPKEGVIASTKDPKADFSKFTTYTWVQGQPAADRVAHKAVTDGIEAELAALGLQRLDKGQGSVTIRYFSVMRTDVDLETLDKMEKEGKPPVTKNLGRLVIVMRDAADKRVWAADTVQPVSSDAATRAQDIRRLVTRMFETYPGKTK
jgi:Domain of unknown function (DUF4136)